MIAAAHLRSPPGGADGRHADALCVCQDE